MKKMNIKKANQKGFTLAEVLITIAIIAILGGVAVFSATTMIKNTRQKTLDKMAETIFLVAERNIQKSYWVEGSNVLGAPGSGVLEVRNTDTTADLVLPQSTVSDEIYSSKWLISYEVGFQNCHIKEVYCTTSDNEYAASFSSNSASDLASVWSSGEGKVGYYGGGAIDELPDTTNLSTDKMYAAVKVENDEELGVGIYIQLPAENKNPSYYDGDVLSPKNVKYKLSVTGLTSNAVFEFDERELIKGSSTFTYQGKTKNCHLNGSGYAIYRDYIVLDNLSSPSTQFKNVVKASTEGLAISETASGLIPGEDIMVEISATCVGTEAELTSDNINLSGTDVTHEAVFFTDDPSGWGKSAQTNSLFAARAVGATATAPDTVEIIYGRHLQNLDATTSGMPTADGNKKIAAIQKANIDFADVSGSYNNNWAQLYNATTNVRFKPIINLLLTKYDGGIDSNSGAPHYISGLKITQTNEDPRGIITGTSSKDLAGLMGCFFGDEISNVHLKNCELNTTSSAFVEAGLLAGRTSQVDVVQIKNCLIEESTVTNNRSTVDAYGYGITGGFVGVSRRGISFDKCQIKKSTITSKDQSWYTGGFVGATSEKGTVSSTTNTYQVNIKDCLVDTCTIHNRQSSAGSSAGGYIGYVNSNQITIADSYVVDSNISAYVGANSSVVGGLVGWFMVKTEATLTNCGVYTTLPENKKLDEFFIESTGNSNGTNVGGGLIACAVVKKLTMDNCFAAMKVNIASNNSTRPAGGLIGGAYSSFGGITYSGPISITNSYADCYIHGTKVGGLVGHYELNSQVFSFENCYSAGCIDGDKTTIAAGVVPAKATIKNSYSLFNFDNVFDTAKFVPAELTYDSEGYVGSYPSEAAPAKATMQMYALAMDGSSVESSYYTYGGEVEEQSNIGEYKNIRDIVEEPGKGAKTGSVNMFILGESTNVAAKNAYEYADAFAGKLKGDEAGKSVIPNIISTLPHFGDWVERSGNQFWARIYKTSESGDKYVMFFEKGMPKKELPTNSDIKLTCVGEWVADDGKAVAEGATPAANSGFLKQADVLPTDSDQSATTKEAKAKLIAPWQYANTDAEKFGWKTDYAANYATILQKITTVTFDEDFCKDTNASPAVSIAKPLSMRKWFKNFRKVTKFNNIKMLDVSNVTSLEETFRNCYEMTAYDLDGWDTAKVTSMRYMFGNNMLEDGTTSGVTSNQSLHGKATSFTFGEKFVTSEVVSMERMFQRQDGLNSTNDDAFNAAIHNFDVSKVKDISFMFSDCHNISKLDLSNWDTSSVENMDAVFYRSTNLADINVTGKFSTVNATTMWALFDMWPSNNVLTTLDVRNFDTSKVKNMAYIFSNNAKLTTIYATSKFTVEALASGSPQKKDDYGAYNTTTDSLMFKDCPVLVGGCGTAWKDKSSGTRTGKTYAWIDGRYVNKFTKNGEGFFTNEDYPEVFARIYENDEAGKYTMYFEYGSYEDNGHSTAPLNEWRGNGPDQFINAAVVPWSSNNKKASITEVIFTDHFCKVAKPVSTAKWFEDFSGVKRISDINKLNTSRVTSMFRMFYRCKVVEYLDLSGMDTSNVTIMSYMFAECEKVREINIAGFSSTSLTNVSYMFGYCYSLLTVYATDAFDATDNEINRTYTFIWTQYLAGGLGTPWSSHDGVKQTRVDQVGKPGLLTDIELKDKNIGSALILKGSTSGEYSLHIYAYNSDAYKEDRIAAGDNLVKNIPKFYFTSKGNGWKSHKGGITEVVFHDKGTLKPTTLAGWFSGFTKLTGELFDVDHNLDTSEATSFNELFMDCSDLTHVDVSTWNTPKLTNMSYMFCRCTKIEYLDLSGLNTSKVTNMKYLFDECNKVKEINIAGWSSESVTDVSYMFGYCYGLLTIYASEGFDATDSSINRTYTFIWSQNISGGIGTQWSSHDGTNQTRVDKIGRPGLLTDINDRDKYIGSALVIKGTTSGEYTLHVYAYNSETYQTDRNAAGDTLAKDVPKFYFFGRGNGWKSHKSGITEVIFHDNGTLKPISLAGWFSSCTKLTGEYFDVDHNLDTSEAISFNEMFRDCTSLKYVDVSTWSTPNLTDVGYMFYHCTTLEYLDLSGLNTSKVTNMKYLCDECNKVKEINIAGWSSESVTDVSYMFGYCYALLTIYASEDFDATDSSINRTYTFIWSQNISGGLGTQWSSHDGVKQTRVDKVGAGGLLTDINSRDTNIGSALAIKGATSGEYTLHVYAYNSDAYQADRDAAGDTLAKDIPKFYFAGKGNGWKSVKSGITEVIFHDNGALKPTSLAGWFSSCTKLTGEYFDVAHNLDTSEVTSIREMFMDCSALKYVDVSTWNTPKLTNVAYMFCRCTSLEYLDLSGLNTSKVTDMSYLCDECNKVREINIAGWSSESVTNVSYMFGYCYALLTIYADDGFDATDNNVTRTYTFIWSQNISGGLGTQWSSHDGVKQTRVDKEGAPGILTDINAKDINIGSALAIKKPTSGEYALHVYAYNSTNYQTDKVAAGSALQKDIPKFYFAGKGNGWKSVKNGITEVIFHDNGTLKPTSLAGWFSSCTKLTGDNFDVDHNLDTSEVTSVREMFMDCSVLTHVDVSTWNTPKLTSMAYMFCRCTALKSIDLRGLDTSKVTDMSYMFNECNKVKAIDITGWSSDSITNISYMFGYCYALRTIYATDGFDATSSGITKTYTFIRSQNIVGGLGTTWSSHDGTTQARVDKVGASGLFTDGSTSITGDSSVLIVEGEAGKELHIYKCNSIAYRSDKNTYTSNSTLVDFVDSGSYANNGREWDSYRNEITNVVFHDTSKLKPTSFAGWFANCTVLTTFDTAGAINTSAATSMESMFEGCTSLVTLDLKKWNTSNVTNMNNMFKGCSALTTITVETFDTGAVTSGADMFDGCTSLIGGRGTAYANELVVDVSFACIDYGTIRPGYLTGTITISEDVEHGGLMIITLTKTDNSQVTIYYYNSTFYAVKDDAVAQYLLDHPDP